MNTSQTTFDQTFEQMAQMWDDLAGWAAGFSDGVLKGIEIGAKDAANTLQNIRGQYQISINKAIDLMQAARVSGDRVAENVFRKAADQMASVALELADDTKTATQRLSIFENSVRNGLLSTIGKSVGPIFDTFGVASAIAEGDGNKAGEAALSMIIGGAFAAAFAGGATLFGAGAGWVAFVGGVGGVSGAMSTKWIINPLVGRPVFDFVGKYIPEGVWRGLEEAAFGSGAARLDPSGAVYVSMLLHRIDQNVKLSDLGRLFDVAGVATQGRETVGMLNELSRIFTPGQPLLNGKVADQKFIEYAGRIAAVTDQIAGGVRITDQIPTLEEARNDFGVLLSLQLGLSITIRLSDRAGNSPALIKLQQIHSDAYKAWVAEKDSSDPKNFTDMWIKDRIALVTALQVSHANENGELAVSNQFPTGRSFEFRYIDANGTEKIIIAENTARAGGVTNNVPSQLVYFGGNGADSLTGTDTKLGDHLYGMAGGDSLDGKGGNDYLEGGIGEDRLIGGGGDDILLGGEGFDTYVYKKGDGADTIRDSDKQGVIVWDEKTLKGGTISTGDRSWRDANGRTYVETDKGLLIDGKVLVAGWKNGDLGLQMAKEPAAQNQAEGRVVRGDPQILSMLLSNSEGLPERSKPVRWYTTPTDGRPMAPEGSSYVDYFMVDANGNPASSGGGVYDDDLTDWNPNQTSAIWGDLSIYGGGGNDHVTAIFGLGKYYVDLGAGDDNVYLGYRNSDMPNYSQWAGFPVVSKNDIVIGGAGSDVVSGGAGDDTIYGDVKTTVSAAIALGNTQQTLAGLGEWLNGGNGDDTIIGSATADVVAGGAGSDLLVGGAGDDALLGDNDILPIDHHVEAWRIDTVDNTFKYSQGWYNDPPVPETSGNDVMYAGAGSDYAVGGYGNDVIFGEAGNDILRGGGDDDVIFGGDNNDVIFGDMADNVALLARPGNDYLDGGAGDDTIYGNEGDDILLGGKGKDILIGGEGTDTYIYNRGDGFDRITDTTANSNVLRFGEGIRKENIQVRLNSSLLDLGNGDVIKIDGLTAEGAAGSSSIRSFEFADGTSLTMGELLSQKPSASLSNGGTPYTLTGGEGIDTFVLSADGGHSIVQDDPSQRGIVKLAEGLSLNGVTVERVGNSLVLSVNGSDATMQLQDFFTSTQVWSLEDNTGKAIDPMTLMEVPEERTEAQAELLWEAFSRQTKASITQYYSNSGWTLQADGTFTTSQEVYSTIGAISSVSVDTWTRYYTPISGSESGYSTVTYSDPTYETNLTGTYLWAAGEASIQTSVQQANDAVVYAGDAKLTARNDSALGWFALNWTPVNSWSSGYTQLIDPYPVVVNGVSYYLDTVFRRDVAYTQVHGDVVGFSMTPIGISTLPNGLPSAIAGNYVLNSYVDKVQQIKLGAGDQTVYANENTMVVGGTGNATILGAGMVYLSEGQNTVYAARTAYGGAGSDTMTADRWSTDTRLSGGAGDDVLKYGDVMDGGQGNDQIFAAYEGGVIKVGASGAGTDLIGAQGDSHQFLAAYYQSLGIENWQERYEAPGKYYVHMSDAGHGYYDEAGVMELFDGWGVTLEDILAQGWADFLEPLPVLLITPDVAISPEALEAYRQAGIQIVDLVANDAAALAVYQQFLPDRKLQFGPGVELGNLTFEWGQVNAAISGEGAATPHTTLNIAWGGGTVQILIPNFDDPIGSGISVFEFVNGSQMRLSELISLAPPVPDLDPQLTDFVFEAGGVDLNPNDDYKSIQFSALDATQVRANRVGNDLVLSVNGSQDAATLQDWYANPLAYSESFHVEFSDGSSWSKNELSRLGTTFIYEAGAGEQYASSYKSVQFAELSASQVQIGRSNADLVLSVVGSDDAVILSGWYEAQSTHTDFNITFSDGASWSESYLTQHGLIVDGSIAGEQTLTGLAGYANTLIAGPDDTLIGSGSGEDTYVFNAGSGTVHIQDSSGTGTLQFGAGITPEQISLSVGSLLLYVGTNGDAIHIEGFDPQNSAAGSAISTFKFANGTTLTLEQLLARGFDIHGTSGDETLQGTDRDDRIYSGGGNDTLIGGAGNDTLIGGLGVNVYEFSRWGGHDVIDATAKQGVSSGTDTVLTNEWLTDLEFNRLNGDVVVSITSTGASLTIKNIDAIGKFQWIDGSYAVYEELSPLAARVTFYDAGGVAFNVADLTFDGLGSSQTSLYDADSELLNTKTQVIDAQGRYVTSYFDVNGAKTGDSWFQLDGNRGWNSYSADGEMSGTSIRPDGSYSEYQTYGPLSKEVWYYDADENLLGREEISFGAEDEYVSTRKYDAADNFLSESYSYRSVNGTYGSGITLADGSYKSEGYDPNYEDAGFPGVVFWKSEGDGQGNGVEKQYAESGVLLGYFVYEFTSASGESYWSSTKFDAENRKLFHVWQTGDGGGDETFNADGSSTGNLQNYADGSYSTFIKDGAGQTSTLNFNEAGELLGSVVNTDDGNGNTTSTVFDPAGAKLSQNWTASDGGTGSEIFHADGSVESTVTTVDPDGLAYIVHQVTQPDGSYQRDWGFSGNNNSGTLTFDAVTGETSGSSIVDGDSYSFVKTLDVDGVPGLTVLSETRVYADGASYATVTDIEPDGSYQKSWSKSDGSSGYDRYNLDGSSSGENFNPEGVSGYYEGSTASMYDDDGQGTYTVREYDSDMTLMGVVSRFWDATAHYQKITYLDADWNPVSDSWNDYANGAWGMDEFHADGSSSGSENHADGSYSSYTDDGHGNIHRSNFNAAGEFLSETWERANSAPEAHPFAAEDALQGTPYTFSIPPGSFTDPDTSDVLNYSAQLADGSALPSWLTFDAQTLTFSGIPRNADVGQLSLEITATDPLGESVSQTFTLNVSNVNDAPVVQQVLTPKTADQGVAFSYTLPHEAFADIDAGDSLSYSVELPDGTALPDWLQFDIETRTLSGTPANENVGSLSLKVTATDEGGLSTSQIFSLEVANVNDAPVAGSSIAPQNAAEDSLWSYVISADAFTDVDVGDSLSYSVTLANGSPLPDWLSFDAATRTLSGTPTNDDVGHLLLKVLATDTGGLSASQSFGLNVTNVNDAPQVVLILVDQTAVEEHAFSYTVPSGAFVDVDAGDTLSYSLSMADGSALPTWLSFDAATRTLSGTPTWGSVGGLDLLLTATDLADASASQTLHILVQSRSGTTTTVVGTDGNDELNFYYSGASGVIVKGLGGDDVLVGTDGADYLFGGDGVDQLYSWEDDDYIDGGGGDDNIAGELGNDMLLGGAGNDSVYGGAGNDYIYGQDGQDYLTGGDGDDYLDGGADYDIMEGGTGNDTMFGGAGGDVLYGDASIDVIHGDDGDDYMEGNDGDDALYGDAGADWLVGGAGADILDGGTGADYMEGGDGNDTYYVDDTGDSMQENSNAGVDTVFTSVTYTLSANLENLTLVGTSAINGTGNALANIITGNSAANTLNGGSGADTMIGGAGDDIYIVDNVGDVVTELAAEGTDLVNASVTYTLGANLENLTLTGTGVINGTGNALNNVLTGNSKANVLTGGDGDDTYIVGTGDSTVEAAGGGTDTVQSSITWTLAANVENLILTGTSAINGTGNALDNVLTGNSAANVLTGGAGNDTYIVGTGDSTVEAAGGGVDTVLSGVTWTLASNVENLTLTGTGAVNGTGNTADNVLLGNTGANTLTGNAGNDTLDGGADADILVGGAGNDTYWLGRGYGADTIQENDATAGNTDLARFGADITTDQLWFRQVGNNLEISVIGTSDAFTVKDWYLGSQYHVEQFKTADGKTLLDSQVQNLVQVMASFSPPAAGEATLSANYASTLNPVIAANWQ